ncbi:MAG: tetratricopeptide repeat protein, partial [Gemmatimonadota bacterium]
EDAQDAQDAHDAQVERAGPDAAQGAPSELVALRAELKRAAERYRSLRSPAADRTAGLEPRPTRVDHLGSSTYLEKGWSYLALGDDGAALQALRRALELAPNDAAALALLGWAQIRRGEVDDALVTLQQVLVLEPRNAMARTHLGYVCWKKRIFGEAIEHLSRVVHGDADPKAAVYARYYLGLVYLDREMYADAEAFFTSALARSPHLGEAHFDLGRVRFLAGNRTGAIEGWRRGAQASRYNVWGERCREALERAQAGDPAPFSS